MLEGLLVSKNKLWTHTHTGDESTASMFVWYKAEGYTNATKTCKATGKM